MLYNTDCSYLLNPRYFLDKRRYLTGVVVFLFRRNAICVIYNYVRLRNHIVGRRDNATFSSTIELSLVSGSVQGLMTQSIPCCNNGLTREERHAINRTEWRGATSRRTTRRQCGLRLYVKHVKSVEDSSILLYCNTNNSPLMTYSSDIVYPPITSASSDMVYSVNCHVT